MVKKFTATCDFGGQKAPVTFYVGNPSAGSPHPLNFQSKWLSQTKGGVIPSQIMESFAKLAQIAEKNRVSFEELCAYVVDEINSDISLEKDVKQAHSIAQDNKNEDNK